MPTTRYLRAQPQQMSLAPYCDGQMIMRQCSGLRPGARQVAQPVQAPHLSMQIYRFPQGMAATPVYCPQIAAFGAIECSGRCGTEHCQEKANDHPQAASLAAAVCGGSRAAGHVALRHLILRLLHRCRTLTLHDKRQREMCAQRCAMGRAPGRVVAVTFCPRPIRRE